MTRLTDPMKLTLVRALACFDTPSQAAAAVKEEFGVEISRQQAAAYDPTKPHGDAMSKKLREVFTATREAFLADMASVPVSHLVYRLRVIQRRLERAEARDNTALVAQLIELAAKEVGGVFTNRRELTGQGGGPIATTTKDTRDLTDQELAAELTRVGLLRIRAAPDPIEAAAIYQTFMR